MKKSNCKHCQLKCKTQGKSSCEKYNAIAERPSQLIGSIREALNNKDHELAKKLQNELFKFNHG
jgi:hypothetical protein